MNEITFCWHCHRLRIFIAFYQPISLEIIRFQTFTYIEDDNNQNILNTDVSISTSGSTRSIKQSFNEMNISDDDILLAQ